MKRIAWFGLLLLSSGQGAFAQQPADNLNEPQTLGRQLLAQSCGVCHLSPSLDAKTYGPPLNKDAANGDNSIMREYIVNGTPRMPAFKHYLKANEIDAIIAYVRTVPSAPARSSALRGIDFHLNEAGGHHDQRTRQVLWRALRVSSSSDFVGAGRRSAA